MKHLSPHGHHSNPLAKLKKRATYFLVFLVVVAGTYLALSASDDYAITGATVGLSETQEFAVSAAFALPESGFDVRDVTLKITLGAVGNFSGLKVDSLNMEGFQGASLVLNGYEGNVAGESALTFAGKADSVIMNDVVINKGGTPLKVEANSLQYDSAEVSGVSAKSFSLVATGTIDVMDKGSFTVDNERVEIKNFNGMIAMDGTSLKLTGSARSLLIDGAPRVSIE